MRFLASLALIAVPLGLSAGDSVDQTLPASADGSVEIINTRGDVEITGWEKNEIRVIGELDDLAEKLVFEVEGGHALIEVKMPDQDINWGDGSDLEVFVPLRSRVMFEGVSTDTEIDNIRGGLKISSVSGDVDAQGLEGEFRINTVSGDITIGSSMGRATINTVSGDMDLEILANEVHVDAVSGDLDLVLDQFSRLRAKSVSGEIDIYGSLADSGDISLSSVSGDISLNLKSPVNARLRAKSGPGGDIVNRISDDRPEEDFLNSTLEATLGNGSARIELSTVSGDLLIND